LEEASFEIVAGLILGYGEVVFDYLARRNDGIDCPPNKIAVLALRAPLPGATPF
jgi:hypothetical protein